MLKRILITILALCFSILSLSQNIEKYDYTIDMKYYKAYYNKDIKTSSFVIYKLYRGGGNVSRSNLSFRPYDNLPHFNYSKSGYDKGHLVPAKDFSKSFDMLRSTFYYVNCIPQNPTLNRGKWKSYEEMIRQISYSDSLLVICGGCDYSGEIPLNCFKVVYSLTTHKCIFTLLFPNNDSGIVIINDKLKTKMTFNKSYKLYNK